MRRIVLVCLAVLVTVEVNHVDAIGILPPAIVVQVDQGPLLKTRE